MKMRIVETLHEPDAPLPLRALWFLWEHLSLLLFMDLMLCLAASPLAIFWLIGSPLLALWATVPLLGPAWAATNALGTTLARGDVANWRDFLRAYVRYWKPATGLSALLAGGLTVFGGTWSVLISYPHMTWLYLPLFVDGCVVTLVLLICLTGFALLSSHSVQGRTLWRVSLAITRLQLGKVLGILALFLAVGTLLWVLNATLLPLLSAPLGVFLAAVTQRTVASLPEQKNTDRCGQKA
ncbi:MAG TPA: hypothetical protein VGD98_07380 [Ktedonobacteraceae bacterium]